MNLVDKNVGSVEYRGLLAGDFPVEKQNVVVKKVSDKLVAGSVVGLATEDKKAALLSKSASDGTQEVYGVLLHDVDASGGDAGAVVAVTGDFVEDSLVFADGTKADDVRAAAEARNIYFHKLVNKD